MLSFGRYFNRDIVFLGFEKDEITAIKAKNGIVSDKASFKNSLGKDIYGKLSEFVGKGTAVFYDYKKERELFEKAVGIKFNLEYIDLKEIGERHFNEVSSIEELTKKMRIEIKEGSNDSELKYALYLRLEKLEDLRMKYFRENHLDVMALGTIADLVPLIDENRIIVKHGLRALSVTTKKGLKALIEKCSRRSSEHISARSVSWDIIPVLNAAGRLGKSKVALELLLSEDEKSAKKSLDEILKLNSERKALQSENTEKILAQIEGQCDVKEDSIIVVREKGIRQGLLGVVASQVSRQYGKPAVVMLIRDDEVVGSCRSVPGVDIVSMLDKMKSILIRYGGHSQAAGFSLKEENLDEFVLQLKDLAKKEMNSGAAFPEVRIDSEVKTEDVTFEFLKEISVLEPFGAGNPDPVFGLMDAKVAGVNLVGASGNHLKLKIESEKNIFFDAVGWNMGHLAEGLSKIELVDIAFNLEENKWQDKSALQMKIIDVKSSALMNNPESLVKPKTPIQGLFNFDLK